MNTKSNKVHIKEFILRFVQNQDIRDDDDMFSLGFVNSLFALQLVLFVEKEFNITIEDEDLEIDNFRSVQAIANLIDRKAISV